MVETVRTTAPAADAAKVKKVKKLSKVAENGRVTFKESSTGKTVTYEISKMSPAIITNLALHGFSQKLGDAAAGKEGAEALAAIQHVYDGLAKGDWSTRAPAGEKVTKGGLFAKVDAMKDGPEKEAAKALLAKILGAAK